MLDSVQISIEKGEQHIKLEAFNRFDIEEEKLWTLKSLWEDFEKDCVKYVYSKIFD